MNGIDPSIPSRALCFRGSASTACTSTSTARSTRTMAPQEDVSLRDAREIPIDSGLAAKLQQLLLDEQNAHAQTRNQLNIERAAHDETAEKMVQTQHDLGMTLKEVAALGGNVKHCISAHVRHEQAQGASSATLASLQKEESHLKFRLLHVHNQIEEAIRAGSDGRAIGSAFSLKHSAPTVAELEEGELTI